MMTHRERIEKALAQKETDRLPYSLWMHFPNRDRMPSRLAELTFRMQQELDLDFVKYMPYGMYSTIDWGAELKVFEGFDKPPVPHCFPIQKPEDWDKIIPRKGTRGEYAVVLESQKIFMKMRKEAIPFLQTVFSPMTTAAKLASEATLIEHLRLCPEKVKRGLEVIMETTAQFAKAAVIEGADGVFFATQMSTRKITAEEHAVFVKAYDLPILNAIRGSTWFNILHIHGADTWFEELLDYPVQALNWHDRDDGPSLSEAREKTSDKVLVGGLSHLKILTQGTDAQVQDQIDDTWKNGGRGVVLGPGCVASPCTCTERLQFIRRCIEMTAQKTQQK
jgi:uroporphyrinogen decarboxylase